LRLRLENNIKNIPSRKGMGAWTGLIWVKTGTRGEHFEDGNEPRVSTK
jgi:hypothetical protein